MRKEGKMMERNLMDKIHSLKKDQMTFIKLNKVKKRIPHHPVTDGRGRKYLVGRRPDGLIVIRVE